jgi:hypothetical protein
LVRDLFLTTPTKQASVVAAKVFTFNLNINGSSFRYLICFKLWYW